MPKKRPTKKSTKTDEVQPKNEESKIAQDSTTIDLDPDPDQHTKKSSITLPTKQKF